MLPATLQFFVAMIASAMAERLTRKVAYMREEVRYVTDPQSRIIDAGSHGRNFWSPVAGESCRELLRFLVAHRRPRVQTCFILSITLRVMRAMRGSGPKRFSYSTGRTYPGGSERPSDHQHVAALNTMLPRGPG